MLNREFSTTAPNQRWAADITYLWTNEGWLYLAVVLDLYSRMIVGWSLKERRTRDLVEDALTMALWRRKPKPGCSITQIAAASTAPSIISVCGSSMASS